MPTKILGVEKGVSKTNQMGIPVKYEHYVLKTLLVPHSLSLSDSTQLKGDKKYQLFDPSHIFLIKTGSRNSNSQTLMASINPLKLGVLPSVTGVIPNSSNGINSLEEGKGFSVLKNGQITSNWSADFLYYESSKKIYIVFYRIRKNQHYFDIFPVDPDHHLSDYPFQFQSLKDIPETKRKSPKLAFKYENVKYKNLVEVSDVELIADEDSILISVMYITSEQKHEGIASPKTVDSNKEKYQPVKKRESMYFRYYPSSDTMYRVYMKDEREQLENVKEKKKQENK